ncbi:MAG: hypothetical protein AAF583_08140 [Pseudomonadota bacterium]
MTDAEILLVFYEIQEAIATSTINFIGVIFAALVGAYIAAEKLDRFMVGIVLTIFTAISLGAIAEVSTLGRDMGGLAESMSVLAQSSGRTLSWHSHAQGMDPSLLWGSITAVFAFLYIGVVVFFFRLRWARFKKLGVARSSLEDL